jgi:integrase
MRITEKTLRALKPPESGSRIHYDRDVHGFGARITAGGVVSFVLNYVNAHGQERRYTFGRYPEVSAQWAHDEALRLRSDVRDGKDPLEERDAARAAARAEPTVADLAEDYIERHAVPHKRPSSVRNDRQMLEAIILPKLGKLRVAAAGKRDIESLHQSLKARPYRANRVLALVSSMFVYAMKEGWRGDNPAKGGKGGVVRFHEEAKERWLSGDEIRQLLTALDEYPDQGAADAIRLLMFTGSREGEVLKAEWDQFDLRRGVWTKPSHHTKQQRTERVPLNHAAMEVLRRLHQSKRGRYLFPGANGEGPRVTLRRPWVQVLKRAGLVNVEEVQGKRGRMLKHYKPAVRLHDLRHTFASHLVSSGASLHIVGKLLGHTLPSTTQRYAHVADRALRDATTSWPR